MCASCADYGYPYGQIFLGCTYLTWVYRILTRCFMCAGCKGSLDGGYLPRQRDGRPCCSAECAAK